MNLTYLFTTARVVRASYQIISTTILLYYIFTRSKRVRRSRRLAMYED